MTILRMDPGERLPLTGISRGSVKGIRIFVGLIMEGCGK